MMRKKSPILLLCTLAFVFVISGCGKPDKIETKDIDVAEELIQELNSVPLGLSIEVEPANRLVESTGRGRYLITFTHPAITFDTSVYKKLNINLPFKETRIPLKTGKVVFKYGPGEKFLELISIDELSLEWDFSQWMKYPGKPGDKAVLSGMAIKISLGKITFKNYDISPLLAAEKDNLIQLVSGFLGKNQPLESVADQMQYELRFVGPKMTRSFLMEAEKIESRQTVLADMFIALYSKDAPAVDLARILKKGTALLDLGMKGTGMKLSFKEGERVLGEGTMDNLALHYFLKPDQTQSFFIYGFGWNMNRLSLSIPGIPGIEQAGHIKEWGLNFSLENLSANFVQAYFDLIKKSMAMSAAADKETIRQQQMMMGMTIASEFMKSKPRIKCSISPFIHEFGELEGELNFQFFNLMSPPVGKAVLRIPHLEQTLAKLKETKVLPASALETFEQLVKKYVVIDGEGNGTVLFETRTDQPGKFFLNGTRLMK